ncbi:hypothetical protein RRG08_024898 [Elysia crispata]|uniref:Uncharacterized protein n=1 Tax=Elysia crispata TaxID=231223 RepID=A0AAE1E6Z2_9GAST|nr:hypothetical protein RRG08_024898 [Elysia crispata]
MVIDLLPRDPRLAPENYVLNDRDRLLSGPLTQRSPRDDRLTAALELPNYRLHRRVKSEVGESKNRGSKDVQDVQSPTVTRLSVGVLLLEHLWSDQCIAFLMVDDIEP